MMQHLKFSLLLAVALAFGAFTSAATTVQPYPQSENCPTSAVSLSATGPNSATFNVQDNGNGTLEFYYIRQENQSKAAHLAVEQGPSRWADLPPVRTPFILKRNAATPAPVISLLMVL